VDDDDKEKLQEFKNEISTLIKNWYEECPRSIQFTSKVIRSYKQIFGEDYAHKKTDK